MSVLIRDLKPGFYGDPKEEYAHVSDVTEVETNTYQISYRWLTSKYAETGPYTITRNGDLTWRLDRHYDDFVIEEWPA